MSDRNAITGRVVTQAKRLLKPAYQRYLEHFPPSPPGVRTLARAPEHAAKVLIGANRYGTYCVPASGVTTPAARAVLSGRVYEPDTLALLRAEAGGRDVVSAGTFFGDFLPALSTVLSDPAARVWAFEPNPESFRCAEMTVSLNGLSNVVLTNAALGATAGSGVLVTCEAGGGSLGGRSHLAGAGVDPSVAGEHGGATAVAVASLDAAIPEDRDVGIVQLDLEGYELEAVRGAVRLIERCRPLLVLESVPADRWFEQLLSDLGYETVGRAHWNTVYRCVHRPEPVAVPTPADAPALVAGLR